MRGYGRRGSTGFFPLARVSRSSRHCFHLGWRLDGSLLDRLRAEPKTRMDAIQSRLVQALKEAHENWKVGLLLLVPLFYRQFGCFCFWSKKHGA